MASKLQVYLRFLVKLDEVDDLGALKDDLDELPDFDDEDVRSVVELKDLEPRLQEALSREPDLEQTGSEDPETGADDQAPDPGKLQRLVDKTNYTTIDREIRLASRL